MSTAKQIAASRANSQKSTGPRTSQGKAASRLNALKHGIHAKTQIVFNETAEDFASLAAELHQQHRPADATERSLVDTLIHNEWRLRRLRGVETNLWLHAANAFLDQHLEMEDASAPAASTFGRLQQTVSGCERSYHRAFQELMAAMHARLSARSQPQESKTTSESSASFRNYPQTEVAPGVVFTSEGVHSSVKAVRTNACAAI